MILDLIRDKNVLLTFSDPAGAKAVLAFANLEREKFRSVVAVSDRVHAFYSDFGIDVERYQTKPAKEWLCTTNVEVLITGTSLPQTLEIDLILEANKAGVVTISFIDHWINLSKRFRVGNSLVLPDWICVVDDRARKLAIEDSLPAEKILVTGNPYYEYVASWHPKINHDAFLESIGLPVDAFYFLYAPEPISSFALQEKYGFTELDGIHMIHGTMRPILGDNYYIVIKGHPNQKDEIFTDYIAELADVRLRYTKNVDINNLIFYSECVFGFFSNSLIEAKILSKLVMRPLMMMNGGAVDPFKEMESQRFLTFYRDDSFSRAIYALVQYKQRCNDLT